MINGLPLKVTSIVINTTDHYILPVECIKKRVSAYIDHIKQINPVINAMVEDRFTKALDEALEMDSQTENTCKGTLFAI